MLPMELGAMIDDEANWRLRHPRLAALKAQEFNNIKPDSNHYAENKVLDPELLFSVAEGDVDNFINVLERMSNEKKLSLMELLERESPSEDSLLHEAVSFEKEGITKLIVHHFPSLLRKKNIKGYTPLHLAARVGNTSIIEILLSYRKDVLNSSGSDDLTRITNEYGNTPLHEAVMMTRKDAAHVLVSADHEALYLQNKEGYSPLYISVKKGNVDILEILLDASPPNDLLNKLQGHSPIHAAIMEQNSGMLTEMLDKRPELIRLQDDRAGTPFHFAVSLGRQEEMRQLLKRFSHIAFERDHSGDLPIHIASRRGHIQILEDLSKQWPNEAALLNKRGQNVLHIAAKSGLDNVVQYMLKRPQLEKLVNEQDSDGNTPLHLATMYLHPQVLISLVQNKRIELAKLNNRSMTAIDIAIYHLESSKTYRKFLVQYILRKAGATSHRDPLSKGDKERTSSKIPKRKWLDGRTNALMVVATLFITVTFAAAFNMPGGYNGSGYASLLDSPAFGMFLICDSLGLFLSIIALFFLLGAYLGDKNTTVRAIYVSVWLLYVALLTMLLAFFFAVTAATNLNWISIAVWMLYFIFVPLLLPLVIVVIVGPYTDSCRRNIRVTYPYCLLRLLVRISGSYGPVDTESLKDFMQADDQHTSSSIV